MSNSKVPEVKNLLNSHSPRSAASLAKNLHELRERERGEDGHACQAAGCLAECQNRCHASPLSPFTYRREVMSEGKKRRDWNIMDLLASPPLSPPLAGPASRRCGFVSRPVGGRPHRQTDRAAPPLHCGRRGRWDLRISHTPMFVHTFFLGMEARSSDQICQ